MALYSQRTLNQIVREIETIANSHQFLNSFTCGTFDDFATSGDTKYPSMWMQYKDISIDGNSKSFNFDVLVSDRVKKDRTNLQEVLSDSERTLSDIIVLISEPDYGWTVSTSGFNPVFEEYMEDEVAGYETTITITQPFIRKYCEIPLRNTITINQGQTQ